MSRLPRLGPAAGRRTRLLLMGMVLAGMTAITAGVTYGAFTRATGNASNTVSAGTVTLGDNDGGAAALSLSSAIGGASTTNCIQVTATGSLPSDVRAYAGVTGTLAPYLRLKVTRGTDPSPSFGSCTGFTADSCNYQGAGAGVLYDGLLSAYPASYAAAAVDPGTCAGAAESWTTGEAHSYKLEVSFAGTDSTAEGKSSTATFRWEARNQ